LHCASLVQRPKQRLLTELDLERIVFVSQRSAKGGIGGGLFRCPVKGLALERSLRGIRTPRNGRDTAERNAGISDPAMIEIKGDNCGRERKFIGLAVSNLDEYRPATPRCGGHEEGCQDVAGLQ